MSIIRRTVGALRAFKHTFSAGDVRAYEDARDELRKYPHIYNSIYGSSERGLQVGAVFACGRILGEDVGSLPLFLHRRKDKLNVERAFDHPLYTVLHDLANPEMPSMQFRESMTARAAFNGAAYARIARNTEGAIVALWPLDNVTQIRQRDGALSYEGTENGGSKKQIQERDIFKLSGFTLNGNLGSPIMQHARSAIGLADAAQQYAQGFFDNDQTPGIYLKHPGTLSPEAILRIRKAWAESVKAHGVAVGGEGMEIQTFGSTNDKAQLIEQRKFQVIEICRWFRMPPHKLADLDRAHFTNVEQQNIDYLTGTLRPWLVRWEQAIYRCLLTPAERSAYYAEHAVEGYLRGDFKTQTDGFRILLEKGVFSINEVRAFFNMNPVKGGDTHLVQLNMADVTSAAAAAALDNAK